MASENDSRQEFFRKANATIHRMAANTEPEELMRDAQYNLAALSIQHLAVIRQIEDAIDECLNCSCDECKARVKYHIASYAEWRGETETITKALEFSMEIGIKYPIPDPRVIEDVMKRAPGRQSDG